MPAQLNVPVWKGNTLELPISVKTRTGNTVAPLDLTGSELVFRAVWSGGSIRKVSGEAGFVITNATQGAAKLTLTHTETRSLPQGDVARFEIERRIGGTQKTILFGTLNVSEWANDDG